MYYEESNIDKGSEFVRVRRDALQRARDTAMEWTVRGRIPECGEFGGIAQDLDAMLSAAPAPQPVHSCPNCLGVDPDSCALDRSPQPVQGEAAGVQESTGCHYCDTGTEHEKRDCMRNPPTESRRPDFEHDAMRAYYATLQRHKIDKDNRTPDEVRRDAVMAAILAASDKPANA